jgi:hypothetical protein
VIGERHADRLGLRQQERLAALERDVELRDGLRADRREPLVPLWCAEQQVHRSLRKVLAQVGEHPDDRAEHEPDRRKSSTTTWASALNAATSRVTNSASLKSSSPCNSNTIARWPSRASSC